MSVLTVLQIFEGSSCCQDDESNHEQHVVVFSKNLYLSVMTDDSEDTACKANNPGDFFWG